ncbi:hypothetical protein ALP94_01616 [Pseudomonas savastanoi pv. glycinea]|nr:hypothetical protein ALP94_01616 [Pseudomonas savastanoi pv. glycinea]
MVSFDYIARAEPMPIEKRTKVLSAASLAVDRGFFQKTSPLTGWSVSCLFSQHCNRAGFNAAAEDIVCASFVQVLWDRAGINEGGLGVCELCGSEFIREEASAIDRHPSSEISIRE